MFRLGIAWVVVSPYVVGLAVANWRPLNRLVTRAFWLSAFVGWIAIAALAESVFVGQTPANPLIAAPFIGLAFWVRRRDDNGDDEPPPPPEALDPPAPTRAKRFDQPRTRVRGPHGNRRGAGKHPARERATR